MKEQPLILTYQIILDKGKVHERSLPYYKESQESTATIETNNNAMVKTTLSRSHRPNCRQPQPSEFAVDHL